MRVYRHVSSVDLDRDSKEYIAVKRFDWSIGKRRLTKKKKLDAKTGATNVINHRATTLSLICARRYHYLQLYNQNIFDYI